MPESNGADKAKPEFDINNEGTKLAMIAAMQKLVALPAGVTAAEFLLTVRPLAEEFGPKAVMHCMVATILVQKAAIKSAEDHLALASSVLRVFKDLGQ